MENGINDTANVTPPTAPTVYNSPVAPPPKKRGWIVIAIVGGILLLAAAGIGAYLWQKKANDHKAELAAQQVQKENDEQRPPASSPEFAGTQAKARDTERQTDINTLYGHLEAYFASNGYYPSLGDLNDPDWRTANIPGIDSEALVDPSSPNASATLVASPAPKSYAYTPSGNSGEACKTTDATCTKHTLTASFETEVSGSRVYTKHSLE